MTVIRCLRSDLGVWQTPAGRHRACGEHGLARPAIGTSTRPRCTAMSARSVQALADVRSAPRGRLRHHQVVERRSGLRQHADGVRRQHGAPGSRLPRPLPDPLADAGEATRSSTRSRRSPICAIRAGSGPSASATSSPSTCESWSTRTGIVPRSTRSNCIRCCSSRSCGRCTPSWASPPRRGARSARVRC